MLAKSSTRSTVLKQLPAGSQHRADPRVLPGRQVSFHPQQLRVTEDTIQRGAQFPRHGGDETGLGAFGLFGGLLRGAQFRLGDFVGGDLLFQPDVGGGQCAE